ncbi:MAG: septum formation inhibitor Maf, partial [Desulfobacterales bacterium]
MYHSVKPLILASTSPRRQDFLRWMGLQYSVEAADIDESRKPEEAPEIFVQRLAKEKGAVIAEKFPAHWVVSGDTAVCLDSQVLGKPQDGEDAVQMLMQLSGRTHSVLSAYSVMHQQKGIVE